MSECHLWVWGEKCAIWVVSKKGEENFYRDLCTKGAMNLDSSQLLLCLPFWLCRVCQLLGLLEADFSGYHVFI